MPTGCTYGIIDGKITTFPQFAKQCMRAFGATIHMRDDDMDAEFKEREPSCYHTKEISKLKKLIEDTTKSSDGDLILKKRKELNESKKYHLEKIESDAIAKKRCLDMLVDIEKWQPPTSEHTGLKDFMREQIKTTIDYDFSGTYHQDAVNKINVELENINADDIRSETLKEANKSLLYHEKEFAEEIKRCTNSNKWVADLINSL